MKRLFIYMLCLNLCLGVVGCGSQTTPDSTSVNITENTSPDASVEASASDTPAPTGDTDTEGSAPAGEDTSSTDETSSAAVEIPFSEDFYDYDSMGNMLAEYGIRFGAAIGSYTHDDYTMQSLLMQHFNSVTATNEMKAYSMLDQKASQTSADGMPVINFTEADALVELAMNCGVQVRGHVLVWDAYMSEWFFCEGYKSNAPYVDRATMLKRLRSYITQVITHFEEKYPGVVYCWDVVNEAVGDGVSDYDVNDDRHVRIKRNGDNNPFYDVIGDDYVEISFLYAKDVVEALQQANPEVDIKLFYNDYSTFQTTKRDAICKLIESINSYATNADGSYRKLCDGMGMQGYIGGYGTQNGCLDINDITKITTAINMYAALRVEVQLTEMAVRNYSDSLATLDKHAMFYKLLMEALIDINSGDEKPLTAITIWGLADLGYIDESDYAYKMNGPYCGLFTPGYYVKDSFYDVYVMLKEKAAE